MSQRFFIAPENSGNGVFIGGQFFPVVDGQITLPAAYDAALLMVAGFIPQERATITSDAEKSIPDTKT